MQIFLLIVSVLALSLFINSKVIKYKRFKATLALRSSYDKMELFIIRNKIKLNTEKVNLLKTFKNLSVNPSFLDLQLLILTKVRQEKRGYLETDEKSFNNSLEKMPDGFMDIFIEFNHNTETILKLSIWKPRFIFFALRAIILSGVVSIHKNYKYVSKKEEVVTYSGIKHNVFC